MNIGPNGFTHAPGQSRWFNRKPVDDDPYSVDSASQLLGCLLLMKAADTPSEHHDAFTVLTGKHTKTAAELELEVCFQLLLSESIILSGIT